MLDLGPHTAFILWSYGITFFVVALLIAWVILDEAQQRRLLQDMEAQGVKRRSSGPTSEKTDL